MNQAEIDKIRIMHQACSKILEFVKEFRTVEELTANLLVWDAVKMNLIVIYETFLKLNNETKLEHNNIDWHVIEERKPVIENIHLGYNGKEIWKVVWERIPEFKVKLERILN